ncbi:nucleotidyl transferase AbiEii/AbiGii toxin family protein [Patescibacteria group bacterium]|nr:nucleotidyl transferase AbiEii/AbiGii toxin family protein [Patescibacteria group bacterium]
MKDIYSDISIAPNLGFKGGTAAFLFYELNRGSVDLDFDLLDESKKQVVFDKIQKIATGYGKIIDSRVKRFNLVNVISYDTKSQNIKIEVNRRDFGSRYELKTLLGISMIVMVREDMFAHKLMAMYERVGKTSRDIYDIWFFLKNNWPVNKEIIKQRSGMSFEEFLQKCAEQLGKMDNRNILVGLGESLTEPQKDWARAKLRTETIFLLRARLESEK